MIQIRNLKWSLLLAFTMTAVVSTSSLVAFADEQDAATDAVDEDGYARTAPSRECEEASQATEDNAKALAAMTRHQIRQIEDQYRARGRELKVVLIARGAKRDMSNIPILGNGNTNLSAQIRSAAPFQIPEVNGMSSDDFVRGGGLRALEQECRRAIRTAGGRSSSSNSDSQARSRCVRESLRQYIFPQEGGQRSSPDYYHVGIALKNHPITDRNIRGAWGMLHELKPSCRRHDADEFRSVDKRRPYIYEEDFVQFYLEKLRNYKSVVIVPSPALQAGIERVLIQQKEMSANFTGARYNAAALAHNNTRDQNSNQWVAEIMAAAQDPRITTREQAQELLRQQNFFASKLDISDSFLYSLGSMADGLMQTLGMDLIGSVNLRKHKLRSKGIIEVVTVRAVQNYMADNRLVEGEYPLQIPANLVVREEDYVNENNRR